MQRLLLVDGSGYFYRAFWAVKGLATSSGLPTNAIFGFTNMLTRLLKEHPDDRIIMVFDAPGPTFRHEEYSEYKANRDAMPEELVEQLPHVKALPPAFGLPTVEIPGVEADDVLGTLAREGVRQGLDVLVVTGDKDLMQLVTKEVGDSSPGVLLFDEGKGRLVGRKEVRKKFGVDPEKVVDVQALLGDASDNIPGVRGIGAKTAPVLIEEFGGLDQLLDRTSEVTRKAVRANLETYREDAILSRRLATIRTNVDLTPSLEEMEQTAPNRKRLGKMFEEFEFSRLHKEWSGEEVSRKPAVSFERYRLIRTEEELHSVVSVLGSSDFLSVDVETDSKDPMRASLVGLSFAAKEGEAYYVPVGHVGDSLGPQIDCSRALAILKPLLESSDVKKIGQNIKYDALVLRRYGVEISPIAFDTMVGAYLSDPDGGPFNLDALSRRNLGHQMIPFSDVVGKEKGRTTFAEVPLDEALHYAAEDADVALRLGPILQEQIRERDLSWVLELEMPLIQVLLRMEMNGMKVNLPFLEDLSGSMKAKMDQLLHSIFKAAGEEFNVDSPKQLQKVLFENLGLTPGRKTKTGYSTDMAVLKQLSHVHPLPGQILEYRTLAKLRNTYVEALPKLVHPETGRIHTSYNQSVAATGRLTSSNPNLQNIPIRTADGREIRRAFVPEEGHLLLAADYSQIELRVMAHLSEDPDWISSFQSGEDIHARTASEVFGEADVSDELRRRAKEINFGIIYGMSAFGLAQRLGIDIGLANEYIERYFSRYAHVRSYIDQSIEEARSAGYVRTLLGRRRYVPNLGSKNRMVRMAAERIAINAPIQGTAADLMKLAMIQVQDRLHRESRKAKIVLQVHDEIVLELPTSEAESVSQLVREEMEEVFSLKVPLSVDVAIGANWAELK